MTQDSLSKSAELQDRLTEAHERHQEVIKKLQTSEEAKRKMKYELQQVQTQVRVHVYTVYALPFPERERERGKNLHVTS